MASRVSRAEGRWGRITGTGLLRPDVCSGNVRHNYDHSRQTRPVSPASEDHRKSSYHVVPGRNRSLGHVDRVRVGTVSGGHLSDQLSRKTMLVTGVSIVSVGLLVLMQTNSYLLFLLGNEHRHRSRPLLYVRSRTPLGTVRGALQTGVRGEHGVDRLSGAAAAGLVVAVVLVPDWQAIFVPVLAILLPHPLLAQPWSNKPMVLERVSFEFWHTSQRVNLRRRFAGY